MPQPFPEGREEQEGLVFPSDGEMSDDYRSDDYTSDGYRSDDYTSDGYTSDGDEGEGSRSLRFFCELTRIALKLGFVNRVSQPD